MPYQFKGTNRWPKLGFIIASLLVIAILASLGVWQLWRADEKRAIEAALEERGTSEPLRVGKTRLRIADSEYRQGVAQGWFDSAHTMFLDNRIYEGHAGYHVLAPLRLTNGGCAVLVNLGWVSMGLDRQQLPVVDTPDSEITAHGTLRRPPKAPFFLGDEEGREPAGWPRRVQYVDLEQLRTQLGYCLQPLVLQLAPNEPFGFVRQWPTFPAGAQRHIAYAVQWFAMALAAMAGFIILYQRNFGNSEERRNRSG